jgi:hypothetical protein
MDPFLALLRQHNDSKACRLYILTSLAHSINSRAKRTKTDLFPTFPAKMLRTKRMIEVAIIGHVDPLELATASLAYLGEPAFSAVVSEIASRLRRMLTISY